MYQNLRANAKMWVMQVNDEIEEMQSASGDDEKKHGDTGGGRFQTAEEAIGNESPDDEEYTRLRMAMETSKGGQEQIDAVREYKRQWVQRRLWEYEQKVRLDTVMRSGAKEAAHMNTSTAKAEKDVVRDSFLKQSYKADFKHALEQQRTKDNDEFFDKGLQSIQVAAESVFWRRDLTLVERRDLGLMLHVYVYKAKIRRKGRISSYAAVTLAGKRKRTRTEMMTAFPAYSGDIRFKLPQDRHATILITLVEKMQQGVPDEVFGSLLLEMPKQVNGVPSKLWYDVKLADTVEATVLVGLVMTSKSFRKSIGDFQTEFGKLQRESQREARRAEATKRREMRKRLARLHGGGVRGRILAAMSRLKSGEEQLLAEEDVHIDKEGQQLLERLTNPSISIDEQYREVLARATGMLRILRLTKTGVSDVGIAEVTKVHTAITTLALSRCALISGSGVESLSQNLSRSLQTLELNECSAVPGQSLVAAFLHAEKLRHLKLNGVNKFGDAAGATLAERCPQLQTLHMHGCTMSYDVVQFKLQKLSNLTALDLGLPVTSHVPPDWISKGVSSFRRLRDLNLHGILGQNPGTIETIAKNNMDLVSLDLGWFSHVSDSDVEALGSLHHLESLDISGCSEVLDNGVIALVSSCHQLRTVKLRGLNKITSKSITAIMQWGHKMRGLDLVDCPGVSHTDVDRLANKCPDLRVESNYGVGTLIFSQHGSAQRRLKRAARQTSTAPHLKERKKVVKSLGAKWGQAAAAKQDDTEEDKEPEADGDKTPRVMMIEKDDTLKKWRRAGVAAKVGIRAMTVYDQLQQRRLFEERRKIKELAALVDDSIDAPGGSG